MQAATIFHGTNENFFDRLAQAGITLAVGLIVWLVMHYIIRIVVKRVMVERTPLTQWSLRWAAPMLRSIDPVTRALDNERRVQRSRTIGSLLTSVLTAVVTMVTGFYVLISFNIDISPLLASVGVLGIAIGFGCQQLIRDFLAGIFIALEDQYGIGDVIQTSEVVGTVEYVGLRITRVVAEDGTFWYLRNGEIMRLGNRSKGNYRAPEEDPTTAPGSGDSAPAQGASPASSASGEANESAE